MPPIEIPPSRRSFLRHALAAPLAVIVAGEQIAHPAAVQAAATDPPTASYQPAYFNPEEWQLLSQLVDRLIPADDEGPGALEAGVPEFIDRQMNEPYGFGALWYMQGPFHEAPPEFGYQLPFTPRALYRAALPAVESAVRAERGR